MMPIHEIVIYFLGHAIIVLKVRNRWAFVIISIMEIRNNKLKVLLILSYTFNRKGVGIRAVKFNMSCQLIVNVQFSEFGHWKTGPFLSSKLSIRSTKLCHLVSWEGSLMFYAFLYVWSIVASNKISDSLFVWINWTMIHVHDWTKSILVSVWPCKIV